MKRVLQSQTQILSQLKQLETRLNERELQTL